MLASQRAAAPFGLLAFLLTTPLAFAGCGGGKTAGSDGNAGSSNGGASAGMTSGGTSAGGTAGAPNTAGAGGAAGAGGKTGTGGAPCEVQECLRANVCLDECGGQVVSSGCCACPPPTVDQLTCAEAAGGQGGGTSSDCMGTSCNADQTCVAYRTVGGAQIPPEGGACMSGKHLENDHCVSDFAYTCATLTGCSAPSTSCHCAAGSQCASANACRLPYAAAWLDTAADLVCEQQAP